MHYDEASRTLTLGAREGSSPGMAGRRAIRARWITPGRLLALDGKPDVTVTYTGASQAAALSRRQASPRPQIRADGTSLPSTAGGRSAAAHAHREGSAEATQPSISERRETWRMRQ